MICLLEHGSSRSAVESLVFLVRDLVDRGVLVQTGGDNGVFIGSLVGDKIGERGNTSPLPLFAGVIVRSSSLLMLSILEDRRGLEGDGDEVEAEDRRSLLRKGKL